MTESTSPSIDGLEVGQVVAERELVFTRDTLVRYAGASGDFNPIHYNDVVAEAVGLPGVIAHGMLTMGAGASVVEEWAGAGNVVDYQVRFTRPIPVPNPGEARVNVTARIGAINEELTSVRIDLTVTHDDTRVLGKAQAVVDCT